MNFCCFPDSFVDVVWRSTATEMDRNWMLACSNIDDWRTRGKKSRIIGKIAYSQGSRHDDQPQWLRFECHWCLTGLVQGNAPLRRPFFLSTSLLVV